MRSPEANQLIVTIQETLSKEIEVPTVIDHLKKLRPYALEEEDPLVTKVIRLSFEHIEANESFQFMSGTIDADEDAEEDAEEIPVEPGEDHENLFYLLDLLKKSDNKFNREEIKEFRTQLKEY